MKSMIDYQNIEEVRNGYRWVKQDCPICDIAQLNF
jgi:hypothetical protein